VLDHWNNSQRSTRTNYPDSEPTGLCAFSLLLNELRYSQTCIKRSPLGQRKSGLLRQVTS